MANQILGHDQLHRLVKLPMDTGEAASPEEAEQILRSYQLGIRVDAEAVQSAAYQAALLTTVNTGRHAFLRRSLGIWGFRNPT